MVRKRSCRTFVQHAYSCLCAYTALDCVPSMGMGHKGQRTSSLLPQTLWIRFCAQRSYSSNSAKGGREYHISHGHFNGIPAASAGCCPGGRSYEGARRTIG